jgi:hypothetical protein
MESSGDSSVGWGDDVWDESIFEGEWSLMVIFNNRQKLSSTLVFLPFLSSVVRLAGRIIPNFAKVFENRYQSCHCER